MMSAGHTPRHRPVHHFPEEMLLDYATGSLPEGETVLVATHLALCRACRAATDDLEAIGGTLLSASEPVELAPDAFDRVLARLDSAAPASERAADHAAPESALPRPLHPYLGGGALEALQKLAWQPLCEGVDQTLLRPLWTRASRESSPGSWPAEVQVSLVRLAPGAAAPRHTHLGIEATVIVQGGFADQFGQYERGDAWIVDASVDHAPVALPDETCLCLVYQDAPLKLTG